MKNFRRVLIIGPYFHDYNSSIERAFQNLSYKTHVIGYHIGETIGIKEKVHYHLTRNKEDFFQKKRKALNKEILSKVEIFRPTLIFIVHGYSVFPETLDAINGITKVLWMMDSIYRSEGAFKLIRKVDYLFLFEKTDIKKLQEEEGVIGHFLPLAVDESIYRPLPNQTKDIDILFIGAFHKKRTEYLAEIVKFFSDRNIKIYGQFYSKYKRPWYHLTRKDKNIYTNRNVSPQEANILYNKSKICINIHHEQSQYGVNQRFFEIYGAGGLQIVDENEYIVDEFKGNEILTYNTKEEMILLIRQVLERKADVEKYRWPIHHTIKSNHTFTKRISSMLDVITKNEFETIKA